MSTERDWPRLLPLAAAGAVLLLAAAGCRQNMHNQNKVKPYRESLFFHDGASARPLPAHTVARGDLREDETIYTGVREGRLVDELPFPLTRDVLARGQERFNIFCSPCHDRTGGGQGMIVRRGYKQPHSYHEARLRAAPLGYFFSVMSEGYGVMPSYADQIPVADRWAITAYIRALQYSQDASLSDLTPAETSAVQKDLGSAGTEAQPTEAPVFAPRSPQAPQPPQPLRPPQPLQENKP